MNYLEFLGAECKNCYKCLRECPVKAISVTSHQAKIIDERCILCGTCTTVCPQNAKHVRNDVQFVEEMLRGDTPIAVSVAPSFVASFGLTSFEGMKSALESIGFDYVEETAIAAKVVADRYNELLRSGEYKNFITSSCPAVNRLVQTYYPKALPYLARVDSPMLAHAKMLRAKLEGYKVVFVGPCIAKKREAEESGLVDAVLTFEELRELMELHSTTVTDEDAKTSGDNLRARVFPVTRGVIKTLGIHYDGYDYIAVDGVKRCMDVLEHIEDLSGLMLEMNACEYACVNGPCSLTRGSEAIKATARVRVYSQSGDVFMDVPTTPSTTRVYPPIKERGAQITEREIREILSKTGKFTDADELNCGACGYNTCREKAWAVANGFAELEMCVPYMRERAEAMSYEVIENSPNGIIVTDYDLKIIEMSRAAKKLLGIMDSDVKGRDLVDYMNPSEFMLAKFDGNAITRQKIFIDTTKRHVELTVTLLIEHKIIFGMMNDITEDVDYETKLAKVRSDTIATTDEVIKKQMRVAQEIASLLGETTAETKVALINLKKALSEEEKR